MTRKDVKNIRQMHSKKTGAIILGVLTFFVIGGTAFMILADEENKKFEIELQNFLALSCEEIDLNSDLERWQREAFLNKVRAGECNNDEEMTIINLELNAEEIKDLYCSELFANLEKETDQTKRQLIHDELKENDC